MKITYILFSIIVLSLFSCGDPNSVEVSEADFSYKPPKNWKLGFESYEFAPEYHWRIYHASYEVKSKKQDTTIAIVQIDAQYLKKPNEVMTSDIAGGRDEGYSLQKTFQKKYGLKRPEICTVINSRKRAFCTSEYSIEFEFQNGDFFIQCKINSTHLPESELYDENGLVNEFDQFIQTIQEL